PGRDGQGRGGARPVRRLPRGQPRQEAGAQRLSQGGARGVRPGPQVLAAGGVRGDLLARGGLPADELSAWGRGASPARLGERAGQVPADGRRGQDVLADRRRRRARRGRGPLLGRGGSPVPRRREAAWRGGAGRRGRRRGPGRGSRPREPRRARDGRRPERAAPASAIFKRPISASEDSPSMLTMNSPQNPPPRAPIGLSTSDQPSNWRQVWRYKRDLLPVEAPYQQVDFAFQTRVDYGTNVL